MGSLWGAPFTLKSISTIVSQRHSPEHSPHVQCEAINALQACKEVAMDLGVASISILSRDPSFWNTATSLGEMAGV